VCFPRDRLFFNSLLGRVLKSRTETGRREEPGMQGTTRELAHRPVTEE